ncbi:F-box protein At3g08750-like [Papaver somniferum]|uniref:F-box protein At3g08750-like n=1 Tax=Papaver somniferum TaxID=3469 RepID=UPI000E7029D3|nr:F-box protein At3g08750-like [Papaver somniferum]
MATLVLPEDVIFQILIWLPVQSLLRFKFVCTSWYSHIQSSHFKQCHATTTTTNVVDKNSKFGNTFICQHETLVPTPPFCLLSDEGFKELEDLGKQPCLKDAIQSGVIDMVDCVHGIICMYNRITRDIVLWNPATRQCRLLPKSSNGNPKVRHYHHDFVGLGFDVETKDYKVIQVSSLGPQNENWFGSLDIPRKVEMYCLSTDSWRLLDSDFRTHCCIPALGESLNGIYYHLGSDYTAEADKYVILSFDLSKDKYQRALHIPDGNSPVLQSIGDKLACITTPSGFHKVWLLSDYDMGKELWTELYRVYWTEPRLQKFKRVTASLQFFGMESWVYSSAELGYCTILLLMSLRILVLEKDSLVLRLLSIRKALFLSTQQLKLSPLNHFQGLGLYS